MSNATALLLIRLTLAALIAAHGWARLMAGAVDPFGVWLQDQGVPFGGWVAWAITVIEIAGTPLLALGRYRMVLPLCLIFSAIYTVGIVMVHLPTGWFVVGLGRNGMEFSVLLIVCLLSVGLAELPRRQGGRASEVTSN